MEKLNIFFTILMWFAFAWTVLGVIAHTLARRNFKKYKAAYELAGALQGKKYHVKPIPLYGYVLFGVSVAWLITFYFM